MTDRDQDPGGGLVFLSGNAPREGGPLTSCEGSEVNFLSDSSSDGDMGEEFDPRLREGSLELRMQLVEEELKKNKERYFEYAQAMDRCVLVRDEQIRTQKNEIEKKDIIIAEMPIKMNELQEWRKQSRREPVVTEQGRYREAHQESLPRRGVSARESENKPRKKTRWKPISPELEYRHWQLSRL